MKPRDTFLENKCFFFLLLFSWHISSSEGQSNVTWPNMTKPGITLTNLCLLCGVSCLCVIKPNATTNFSQPCNATHNLPYTEPNLVEVLCVNVVIVVGVIRLQKNLQTKAKLTKTFQILKTAKTKGCPNQDSNHSFLVLKHLLYHTAMG